MVHGILCDDRCTQWCVVLCVCDDKCTQWCMVSCVLTGVLSGAWYCVC